MKETYYFRVKLEGHAGIPILNIEPVAYGRKINIFCNYFKELNVPIRVSYSPDGLPIEDSFDLGYKLVFDESFTKKVKNYNIFSKRNLERVLKALGRAIDNDLRGALCFKNILNKRVRVVSDNGRPKKGLKGHLPFDGGKGKARVHRPKKIGII